MKKRGNIYLKFLAVGLCAAGAALPAHAAPYGPGAVSLIAQGASGTDSLLDSASECFSLRFTALHSGELTDFCFVGGSRGFTNKDPNGFLAELYADNGSKPGALIGAAKDIVFGDGGFHVRSVRFAGLNVEAGKTYHVVLRSNPANAVSSGRNFSVNAYNLARPDAGRLDSGDTTTANPGYGFLHSNDGGATWSEIPNTVAAHTVAIGGVKQGWGYFANFDDLTAFKMAGQAQYIAQGFTAPSDGDAGWVTVGLRPQGALANQLLGVVFRIARAADFSVVAAKTASVQFGPATVATPVSMDFSGTALKAGEIYIFFAGLEDEASLSTDDYLFVRSYLGASEMDYTWQGQGSKSSGSRAFYSKDMKSLSESGQRGAAAKAVSGLVDIGLVIGGAKSMAEAARGGPAPQTATLPKRGLKICVAANASDTVKNAAKAVLAACASNPLLSVMSGGQVVTELTDTKTLMEGKAEERAYNHLVLIGTPDDPAINAAWQREAKLENGGWYVFGWGHLRGDIGYIEGDRNPFLHSAGIASAPFETEVVTLTGNTPKAIALAVDAFLKNGLVNGVVAAPGWTRASTTVLDRDPLAPAFTLPEKLPAKLGDATLVGLTPGGEDEYRGVLADAGVEPSQIWRAKYYVKGAWDGVGAAAAFDAYSNGLHRRAYGNTLWVASFASANEAAAAAPKIAAAAKLTQSGVAWTGSLPPYANGNYAGERPSSGPLRLWRQDNRIFMSTLPLGATNMLAAALPASP